MKSKVIFFRVLNVMLLSSLVSCTQLQQRSAAGGALAGVALGALSGNNSASLMKGATLGAALGAGGAAIKENLSKFQLVSPSNRQASQTYPYATRTSNPDYVKSPYAPYRLMDVKGIASGKMAKEPGSSNIFLIP